MKIVNDNKRIIELHQMALKGIKLEYFDDAIWCLASINADPLYGTIRKDLEYRVKTPTYSEALAIAIDGLDNEEWGNNEECYQSIFDKGMAHQKLLEK